MENLIYGWENRPLAFSPSRLPRLGQCPTSWGSGFVRGIMYKIIGGDGKEYGPATAEEIRRWIVEGRLNGQSLVQSVEVGGWKPLATFGEFAGALALQTVQLPSPGPALALTPGNDEAWQAQVLARPAQLRIGHCLASSGELLMSNFGLLAGASLLTGVILLVCELTPLVGGICFLLFKGVFLGGLYLVFLKRIRGQPASTADLFAGFTVGLSQLMFAGAITSLATFVGFLCCFVLPGLYLLDCLAFQRPIGCRPRPGVLVGHGTQPEGGHAGLVSAPGARPGRLSSLYRVVPGYAGPGLAGDGSHHAGRDVFQPSRPS